MSATHRWLMPQTLTEAVAMWSDGATIVGGGVALASAAFPAVRGGDAMLDLGDVGLDELELPRIGAMVSLARLLDSAELALGWPAVWEALAVTAHPGIRRLATVGGTVAARLPGSDLLCALCAYGSTVTVWDAEGVHCSDLATALRQPLAGIVAEIRLGPPAPGAYRRATGRAGFGPAIAAVAGVRRGETDELWAGAVGAVPLRIDSGAVPAEAELIGDERCSAWYRRRLLEVLRDEVLDALSTPACASHRPTDAPRRSDHG